MCTPVALTLLSAGMSAYGAYSQGKAAQQAANYQAQVAENNAKISGYRKDVAEESAAIEKDDLRRQVARLKSTGRTTYAAGNVMLGTGAPLSWEQSVTEAEQEDIRRINRNLDLEKWGYDVEASNYQSQANLSRMQGANAKKAANISVATSLLGSASQFGLFENKKKR